MESAVLRHGRIVIRPPGRYGAVGTGGGTTLSRETIIPVLLLAAFVAAVFLGQSQGKAREAPERRSAPVLRSSSGAPHGLKSASWRTPGADAEDEYEPDYAEDPEDFVDADTRVNRIPDEVRERLARSYVGLDIALARSHLDEEAPVRR